MLTTLLEKGSWIIFKVGMPLVFFYHLLLANVFINTAAQDAQGLERLANIALIPTQYLLDGKLAIVSSTQENISYRLSHRFTYQSHFFLKTATSATLLPISLLVGGGLKSLSYLSKETRHRADKIYAAMHTPKAHSLAVYYQSIGLPIQDFTKADSIAAPKWKRQPGMQSRLQPDMEALKEIIVLLTQHNIPFWLDCGSCLGAYQYGGAIPHDWDIDIGVLLPDFENIKQALQALDPAKFVVQDWSGRARPNSYLKVYVRQSGNMIDLYHFGIDVEKKELATVLSNEWNIFLPTSWKVREKRYCTPMPFSYIFPLKKALFEGIEVPVPGNIEPYLQTFYGQNLAPAKLYNETTKTYERDPTHPYWQLPHAH